MDAIAGMEFRDRDQAKGGKVRMPWLVSDWEEVF